MIQGDLEYGNPRPLEHDLAEEVLRRGADEEVQETLVGCVLGDDDWAWLQEQCLACSRHPSWSVRAVAATCFGHLARIHKKLDMARVMPQLDELLLDPRTAAQAQGALDDLGVYLPSAFGG